VAINWSPASYDPQSCNYLFYCGGKVQPTIRQAVTVRRVEGRRPALGGAAMAWCDPMLPSYGLFLRDRRSTSGKIAWQATAHSAGL